MSRFDHKTSDDSDRSITYGSTSTKGQVNQNPHKKDLRCEPLKERSYQRQEMLESKQDADGPGCMKLNSIRINRPLIPLKISLFLWYAAGAVAVPYLQIYFTQLGISLSQLSIMLALTPILQFIGPTLSGIIADKIGRSKPVLLANLFLVCVVLNSVLLVPQVNVKTCFFNDVQIECSPKFSAKSLSNESCPTLICLTSCADSYQQNASECVNSTSTKCNARRNESLINVDFYLESESSAVNGRDCLYNLTTIGQQDLDICESAMKENCSVYCTTESSSEGDLQELNCPHVEDNVAFVFTVCIIISILFNTLLSNCYRFMDVTTMSMIKTYNSEFGRERFWAILSVAIMSPLAGYLVDLTTPEGKPRNCAFAFYFFDAGVFLTVISVYKLDVQINPPGKNMWRKAVGLFKDLDIMAFAFVVLVLGISWGFTKMFFPIYLDRLGSPSILLGLIFTVNSVSGLPFLLTSEWWMKKLGSSNLLIAGLLGYIFLSLGYAYITSPWHALIFETSAIFTYHLLWVAVIRHSHEIAPAGLTATVISAAGGIHFALGRGTGSLIGGQIMSKYGGRWAYRTIAAICGCTTVIYALYLQLRKKQKCNFRDDTLEIKGKASVQNYPTQEVIKNLQ